VYGIDRKAGKEAWKYEAGGRFRAAPAAAGGRMVIGNENGTLYCFGAK
jgi:outer membrane protein assembly factor BamB